MSDDMGATKYNNPHYMHYVYYLKMSNGQIYTVSSSNLKRRFSDHKAGRVRTTSKFLPVMMIGYEAYLFKSGSQRRERYMKTTEGKRMFRQQYRDCLGK